MQSLLNDLRSKHKLKVDEKTDEYNKAVRGCPPVSAALIAHLQMMFTRREIKPTDPTMQQELVFQAGIDKVIEHLRRQNDRQENEVRNTRTKES